MTQHYDRTAYPSEPDGSTAQTAKDQAANVAESAAQSGAHLVDEARTQVADVGREAGRQARVVLDQSRDQLTQQAAQQQRTVAGGIRSIGGELSTMASASNEPGIASDVVRQVATRADSLATWLDEREPGDLLEEVKSFARARPGTFLVIAAGAGLLAGRLTRGLKDGSSAVAPATHRAPGAATTTSYGRESVAATTYPTQVAPVWGTGSSVESGPTGGAHASSTTGGLGYESETAWPPVHRTGDQGLGSDDQRLGQGEQR